MALDNPLLASAKSLGASGSYTELANALGELSVADSAHAPSWAAQAVWVAKRCPDLPAEHLRSHYENLFQSVPRDHRLVRNLAAALMWRALPGGAQGGDADASINASHAARVAAEASGAETQADFDAWLHELLSQDAPTVASEIDADLLQLIGDSWLFDPDALR